MSQLTQDKLTEVWDNTFQKFERLERELGHCSVNADTEKAKALAQELKEYSACFYCVEFRLTTENRGSNGICGACPLHRYGESLVRTRVGYNGCYRIADYRMMVRAACWLDADTSAYAIGKLIDAIGKVKRHLVRIKPLLTGL